MNSVALTAPALSAEADLIHQAERGSPDAFGELYRRHGQTAWRLAQAVAPDPDGAMDAVAAGFAQTKRNRHHGGFRSELLAAVYSNAGGRAGAGPINLSVTSAEAAFRRLPERWRAALWLSEVESMDPTDISDVLAVSAAEAAQLVHRGRRGLAGYYAEVHRTAPDPIGPVVASFARPVPTDLAQVAEARWAASGRHHEPGFAHRLEDRAVRPLWVSVGGLMALGLMGLGVLAPGNALGANLGGNANDVPGAVPVQTCYGIPCPAQPGSPGPPGGSVYSAFNPSQIGTASKL